MEPLRVHPKDAETIWNRKWRLQHLYPIRTEDRKLRYLNMSERPIQEALFAKAEERGHRGIRIINVKARKLGVTTLWSLYYLDDTLWTPNTTSCILAHTESDVRKLFQIVKTAYRNAPDAVKLASGKIWYKPTAKYDNVNELVFDGINSKIYVALQSRGETNNNLHVSEAAHIPDDEERMAATMESVPNREFGSNITVESSANGIGGWFHDSWYDAEAKMSQFEPVFFPWFSVPKNRVTPPADFYPTKEEEHLIAKVAERYGVTLEPSQVFWWRQKKVERKRLMNQEHPTFPDDAFLSSGMMVFEEQAVKDIQVKEPLRTIQDGTRIWAEPKAGRRYIVSGDPAEGVGGDGGSGVVPERRRGHRRRHARPGGRVRKRQHQADGVRGTARTPGQDVQHGDRRPGTQQPWSHGHRTSQGDLSACLRDVLVRRTPQQENEEARMAHERTHARPDAQ